MRPPKSQRTPDAEAAPRNALAKFKEASMIGAPQDACDVRAERPARVDAARWRRWVKYAIYGWRRMLRVRATPHEIALGAAAGVFAACTPFLGFQMALAVAIAVVLRVSIPAALLGTFIGNPVSWPAIWSASYVAGAWVLGHDAAHAASAITAGADALGRSIVTPTPQAIDAALINLAPLFVPLLVGGLLVGSVLAAGSYYPTRRAVRLFQTRRQRV